MNFINPRECCLLLNEFFDKNTPWYWKMYGIKYLPEELTKTILDIGANVGFCSVGFRYYHSNSRIISIEPDENTFKLLVANTNGLRIETYKIAFGNGNVLAKTAFKRSLMTRFVKEADKDYSGEKSDSVTLRGMINKYKINIDGIFIKIDCEGGEKCLINHKDSEDILRKSIGFGVELHNDVIGVSVKDSIKWLKDEFSITHDLFMYNAEYCVHATAFRKDLKILKRPY